MCYFTLLRSVIDNRTYGNGIGNGRGIHTSLCDDACCAATVTRARLHWALTALLCGYERTCNARRGISRPAFGAHWLGPASFVLHYSFSVMAKAPTPRTVSSCTL